MKWLVEAGTTLYDYIMTTLLLLVAGFLIVPFLAVYVGIIGFYDQDRSYGTIWRTIKTNAKPLAYTTVILLLIILSAYSLNAIGTDLIWTQATLGILALLAWLIFTYVPIILIRMRVTLSELTYNALSMAFHDPKTTLFLILLFVVMGYVFVYELIAIVLLAGMFIRSVHYLTARSFDRMIKKIEENEK
ncbi:MAG: hypothetical protein ACLFTZ_03575 [Acholeplasmataceae bacterium]